MGAIATLPEMGGVFHSGCGQRLLQCVQPMKEGVREEEREGGRQGRREGGSEGERKGGKEGGKEGRREGGREGGKEEGSEGERTFAYIVRQRLLLDIRFSPRPEIDPSCLQHHHPLPSYVGTVGGVT